MTTELKLRMSAYYYGFEPTGVELIDRILSAVACAGKAYHHTESWCDPTTPYEDCHRGKDPIDWIQNAANDAAAAWNRRAESEPSKAEPFCYVAITGHGKHYRESLEGLSSEVRSLWKPLYDHPPPPAPDVSIKAGEIDLSDAEIVKAVHAIGGTGRVSLTFTNNDGEEKPTIIVKDLIRALLAAKGGE